MLPKKSAAKQVPIVCIRKMAGRYFTWCGREFPYDEFVFDSAAHAVTHYANGTSLKACPDCVAHAAPVVKQNFEAPLATRGLNNR